MCVQQQQRREYHHLNAVCACTCRQFIPNVGALIAVAAPMPLVLFSPSFGVGAMVLAALLPLLVHVLVGNLLEPIVFGRAMELHPVTVLLSLMLWCAALELERHSVRMLVTATLCLAGGRYGACRA